MGDVIDFAKEKLRRSQRRPKVQQTLNANRALCSGGTASTGRLMNWQSYEEMLEDIYKMLRAGEIKPTGMILIFNGETSYHYFMRGFEPAAAIDTMADVAEDLENY